MNDLQIQRLIRMIKEMDSTPLNDRPKTGEELTVIGFELTGQALAQIAHSLPTLVNLIDQQQSMIRSLHEHIMAVETKVSLLEQITEMTKEKIDGNG